MNTEHVLVVDDNEDIRNIIGHTLNNYRVSYAENGIQALEKIAEERPDLVILDIMMPEMDGYEFLDVIQNNPDQKYIKVLVVSAKAMVDDQLMGLQRGALDYITKPFNRGLLREKVSRIISVRYYEEVLLYQRRVMQYIQNHTETSLSLISGSTCLLETTLEEVPPVIGNMISLIREGMEDLNETINQAKRFSEVAAMRYSPSERVNMFELLETSKGMLAEASEESTVYVHAPEEIKNFVVDVAPHLIVESLVLLVQAVTRLDIDGEEVHLVLTEVDGEVRVLITGENFSLPETYQESLLTPFGADADKGDTGAAMCGIDLSFAFSSVVAHLFGGRLAFLKQQDDKDVVEFSLPKIGRPSGIIIH